MKQGFSWWSFANRGVEASDLLEAAAKIGYKFVDLADESLWPIIVDHGLGLGAIAGQGSMVDGLNRRENAEQIEAELRSNIDKAVHWQIPILICFSGNRNGLDEESGLTHCAETLARIAPEAEQAGVVLAMELLNSKVDHIDYQCDSTAWGRQLCERVGSPAVKLLYDIYHMQIMEGDLIRTIRRNHSHIGHYHTAGNPGRGQPDRNQEINYPAIYQAIAEVSPDMTLSHEFLPAGNPVAGLQAAYADCVAACGTENTP